MNMSVVPEHTKRRYRMHARAEATAATGERILAAAAAAFWERPVDDISLGEVARRAGVSQQTVIRRFGDKERLFATASERESARIRRQRDEAPVGDVAAAVRILLDHYEELGESVLRLLAEEDRSPALREIADRGRAAHAQWCERVFAPALTNPRDDERARRLAQLVALTDVLMWKLLRRDQGLSRGQTELALCELIEPLMGGN
ncbi:MAG: TetR/AcrR family transcriptional regulator [Ktedonobacterales bacterium]|jgi:AcrR family transcriptional regulator